jgi:prepilin peptidase CpaA
MPTVDPATALWFLPFTIPIAIWVSWSDMKFMKIPNKSVLALAAIYLITGPFILPLTTWLWGIGLGLVVLVFTFVMTAARAIGAGDAKFAAAMAPFFVGSDMRIVFALFAACLLGAFASHRAVGLIGPFRAATGDWESWTHKDFPMGLALSGTLIFYPLLSFWLG